ncbi:hypothetical protein AJ79_09962 [Helicocarpus griseus UAMH5409]|uniref:F-box domain-containing protein n=1 Tax=Helicocarpus griseus UAMH5409 TaxID=1447875 RepID=A0A2B7WG79_9EURO|nr:hypothetical protein AJ79_09962 [Helicocarpus griseus UAMH5409]
MEKLPVELVSRIVEYIDPQELSALQLVSRRFFDICRDNSIWRQHCYEKACGGLRDRNNNGLLNNLRPEAPASTTPSRNDNDNNNTSNNISNATGSVVELLLAGHANTGITTDHPESFPGGSGPAQDRRPGLQSSSASNWDPSYEGEKVDWYSEYIARNAKISVQWLQEPYAAGAQDEDEGIIRREVKGMGLMKDYSYGASDKIVGPLDDGTVCLWNLNRSTMSRRGTRGKIVGLSEPGALTTDTERRGDKSSSNVDFIGVGECVSVDSFRQTAYIAVGTILKEVDLSTLKVIHQKKFPWSVFALSQEAEYAAPLTVGTTRSLHLYDSRSRSQVTESRICSPMPLDSHDTYVSLFQPIPLSILHPPLPNINSIALAGRFSALLLYDRRNISRLLSTAHSGARICGLAALPTCPRPYSSDRPELQNNHTIIACGEYKGRGSLEMFSTSTPATSGDYRNQERSLLVKNSISQNRQSASGSKLLSVANHGTRIVFTDANGYIKWVERDGRTEVRRWNLSQDTSYRRHRPPPFKTSSINDEGLMPNLEYWGADFSIGSSDIVRKILPTGYSDVLDDELLIWTGDRIGRLRFSEKPGHDWNYEAETYQEESEAARRENEHKEAVHRSLHTHRNELNWMGDFGTG